MGRYLGLNEEFLSFDKSQSKHSEAPPRSQIPVDADWTSSSAIFTVCRRIDLSMRGYPRSTLYATYHLRLYMHINRDNRGSLATAYRARGVVEPTGTRGTLVPSKGILLPTCKWSAFIVRKESAVWICEVEIETKKKEEIWTVEGQRSWDEERPVRGKAEIARYREMMQLRLNKKKEWRAKRFVGLRNMCELNWRVIFIVRYDCRE